MPTVVIGVFKVRISHSLQPHHLKHQLSLPHMQTEPTTATLPPGIGGSDTGAVAGGVIGGFIGVVLIVLIIIIIAYLIWKAKTSPSKCDYCYHCSTCLVHSTYVYFGALVYMYVSLWFRA